MIDRAGIWIPAQIWNDHRLSLIEKVLLSEVLNFGERGSSFFKSNEQIAREMDVSISSIQRAIRNLESLDLIKREPFDGRRRSIIPGGQTDQADRSNRPGRVGKMMGQTCQIAMSL